MKLIFTLVMAFIFQSSLFSQKGKTVTEYYYKELKSAEGKVDKDGKKTGEWKFWNISGDLCQTREYKNDILEGSCLIEKRYLDKMYNNPDKFKDNDELYKKAIKRQKVSKLDSIEEKCEHKNGSLTGPFIKYDVSGKIKYEGTYLNGNEHGETKYYDSKDGYLSNSTFYRYGRADSIYFYYPNGQLKTKSQTKDNYKRIIDYRDGQIISIFERKQEGPIITKITCKFENGIQEKCDTVKWNEMLTDEYGNSNSDKIIVEIPNYKKNEVVVDEIFDVVEEQPQYPGGNEELYKFISTNYKLDSTMIAQGMQGKIYVNFVIDKDGSVTQAKVLRGLSEPMNLEALRVVSLMPKWIPGKQRGKEVKVRYTLPIVVKYEK